MSFMKRTKTPPKKKPSHSPNGRGGHDFIPWLSNIVSTPGVCGGVPRIIRTRIPVWTLERMRQLGVSESEILRSFPTLRAVDLVQAWSYVDLHRDEIEQQIRENEED